MYLLERVNREKVWGGRERKNLKYAGSLPSWLLQPALGKAKAKGPETSSSSQTWVGEANGLGPASAAFPGLLIGVCWERGLAR